MSNTTNCCPDDCQKNECCPDNCTEDCECQTQNDCEYTENSTLTKSYNNLLWFLSHRYTTVTFSHVAVMMFGFFGGRVCTFRFN